MEGRREWKEEISTTSHRTAESSETIAGDHKEDAKRGHENDDHDDGDNDDDHRHKADGKDGADKEINRQLAEDETKKETDKAAKANTPT